MAKKIKVGYIFTYLTVEKISSRKDNKNRKFYICKCRCGKITEVRHDKLLYETTKSCGCYAKFKQGQESLNKTHNMSKTKEYKTWQNIKKRCLNENNEDYKDYGQKGIKISPDWIESFENFFLKMLVPVQVANIV